MITLKLINVIRFSFQFVSILDCTLSNAIFVIKVIFEFCYHHLLNVLRETRLNSGLRTDNCDKHPKIAALKSILVKS